MDKKVKCEYSYENYCISHEGCIQETWNKFFCSNLKVISKDKIDLNDVYDALRCLENALNFPDYDCKVPCDIKGFCKDFLKLLQHFNCERGERDER